MEILWTRLARADLNGIWDYIERSDPTAAELAESRILAAVEGLSECPRRGRPGRVAGTRELVLPATPYIVVYTTEEPRVVVLRVIHGAMDRPGGG